MKYLYRLRHLRAMHQLWMAAVTERWLTDPETRRMLAEWKDDLDSPINTVRDA